MLQIKKREEKQNVDQNMCLCVLHNKLLLGYLKDSNAATNSVDTGIS